MLNRVLFGFGSVLGIAALIALSIFFHTRAVHQFGDERYQAGLHDAHAADEEQSLRQQVKDAALAAILRERTNAQTSAVHADAGAMRLRGAGNALCTGVSPAPAAASGHNAPDRPTDAPVVAMSDPVRTDLIALPFNGTLAFAEQCDANRLELMAWRAQREGTSNGAH